jgi:ubiquitin C-terminal hydrolase
MNNKLESFQGVAGLANMGNTCYLNSILQILSNTPKFRELFISKEYRQQLIENIKSDIKSKAKDEGDKEDNNIEKIVELFEQTLSYQFERLFTIFWNNDRNSIESYRPLSFKNIIGKKYKHFNGFNQQDAQECLITIFDIVENEIGCSINLELTDTENEQEKAFFIEYGKLYEESLVSPKDKELKDKIKLIEEANISLVKQFRELSYLKNKYKKKYSICEDLFSIGSIQTLNCLSCSSNSYKFEDNYCVFVEIPDTDKPTDEEINEKMKTIKFPFEEKLNKPNKKLKKQITINELNVELNKMDENTELDKMDENTELDKMDENTELDKIDENTELDQMDDSDSDDNELLNDKFSKLPVQILDMIRRTTAYNNIMASKEHTLEKCLDLTFSEEQLDCELTCNHCLNKSKFNKMNRLWSLPKYLIIQLKRFDMLSGMKKNQMIRFEETLDIGNRLDNNIIDKENTIYNLIGVVNHIGNINGGHYYAYCKNTANDKWLDFNDGNIRFVENVCTSSAYILIYEMKEN